MVLQDYQDDNGNVAYTNTPTAPSHGHFNFVLNGGGTPSLSDPNDPARDFAHTGDYSIEIPAGGTLTHEVDYLVQKPNYFTPRLDAVGANTEPNEYVLSAWVYVGNNADATITFEQDQAGGSQTLGTPITVSAVDEPIIEGWKRIETRFQLEEITSTLGSNFRIIVAGDANRPTYIDDIRVHPHKGAMTTYIYDPIRLWLLGELDNRNFATLYDYDEEGTLVQVKKETYRGFITLSHSRQNVVQKKPADHGQ